MAYCQVCHGASGQGFRGYYPIPRLAGQQPEYFENQLQAFIERRRTNNIMFNVAHVLSPAMLAALAANFKNFDPKTPRRCAEGSDGRRKEDLRGRNSLPPMFPRARPVMVREAKGDGQFPRLAGQLNDYIFNKLTNWSKERGQNPSNPDASSIMEPIAHSLTKPQIEAVAAYVSNLE